MVNGMATHVTGMMLELDPGSYTTRKNAIRLTAKHIYASHAGCIVHAVMGLKDDELGDVDWTR